jgi:hypothetical protein
VARDADHIDVFAPGDDGKLWHRSWDGSQWRPWHEVVGAPRGATAVSADWAGARLDLYVRDGQGDLWYVGLTA